MAFRGSGTGGASGGSGKAPVSILDRSVSRGKSEVSLSTYALLFSEMIRYAQNRVSTIAELEAKLAEMGAFVGARLVDVLVLREKGYKRETRVLGMLMLLKGPLWRALFGREAEKLERSNEDPATYLLIEKEPLLNTFISVPKDKGSLHCGAFVAGIVQAILSASNFPCQVSAHWHSGTTYMIRFSDEVIQREKAQEGRS